MSEIIRIDLGGVNCYLAKCENGFILFDTGGHLVMDKEFTNRCERLQNELEAAGCTKDRLQLIVLTHGDNDHACNAAIIRAYFHTKIAMHGGDRKLVEEPSLNEWMESFHYHSIIYRLVFGLMSKTVEKLTRKTLDEFKQFSPDILLEDGFDLSEYGLDAKVIHVPGHTKGSIAVLTHGGDLIAGDTFANMNKPSPALNANDFTQLAASIDKLKNFAIETVYPGHGKPFRFGEV